MSDSSIGWHQGRSHLVLTGLVGVLFCLQSYNLVVQLLLQPTASSFTLVDNVPPRLPAVTVCPSTPFTAHSLIQYGLNVSCDTPQECRDVLQTLEGLPESLYIRELWDASILPLTTYVEWSSIHGVETTYHHGKDVWPHWKVSNTSFGPCWTLVPPLQKAGESIWALNLRLRSQIPCSRLLNKTSFPYNSCEKIENICNRSCSEEKIAYHLHTNLDKFLILLHPVDEPPTAIEQSNVIYVQKDIKSDLRIMTWLAVRDISMLQVGNCVPQDDYSFSECISLCYEDKLKKQFYREFKPNTNKESGKLEILWFLRFREHLLKNLETHNNDNYKMNCKEVCKIRCKYTQYTSNTEFLFDYDPGQQMPHKTFLFTLRLSSPYSESVVEEEIYTTAKFLSDLGGSLGLCFGMGLLTLSQKAYSFLKNAVTKRRGSTGRQLLVAGDVDQSSSNPFISHESNVWKISEICLYFMLFTIHIVHLTVSYLEYQTVFVTNIVGAKPGFPSVTLCPDVPFDLISLTQFGLSIENDSEAQEICNNRTCKRQPLITHLMNTLPGLWYSNLSLVTVWNASRPFQDIIEDFMYDSISNDGNVSTVQTTMGNCITLSPKNYQTDISSLDIVLANEEVYMLQEYRTIMKPLLYQETMPFFNATFMIHDEHHAPLHPDGFAILYDSMEAQYLGLEVTTVISKRISTPRVQCYNDPYSRRRCMDSCFLEEVAKRVGCRLPYLTDSDLPLCITREQYAKSIKYKDPKPLIEVSICEDKCPPQCSQSYHSVVPQAFFSHFQREKYAVNIKQQLTCIKTLSEQLKTSFSSYICEVGGVLGLYLGLSLLDLTSWFVDLMHKLLKRFRPLQNISTIFSLLQILWWLVLSWVLFLFSLTRLQEFVITPKFYTKYSEEIHSWKDFPGITLCRWPPFNLTSLESMGINLHIQEPCGKGFYKYSPKCTTNFHAMMNTLPGLESLSVPDVWEEASWNLSDILYSYNVSGHRYHVGSSTLPHWSPTITSLNRCYTFTPPNGTQPSDLYLELNTYYYKFQFEKRPSLTMRLRWLLTGAYSPHNLIQIHAPQDNPILNSDVFSIPLYLTSMGEHYKVTATLTKASRLKGGRYRCRQEETYSNLHCVQRCLLELIVQHKKCRLPFVNSSADFCNATLYKLFPKYLDTISLSLEDYTEARKECVSRCPDSCTNYNYIMRGETERKVRDNRSDLVRVTVALHGKKHDSFEEVAASSWSTFVAEVGGVAGTLTGTSVLLLLEALKNLLVWVHSRIRGGEQ